MVTITMGTILDAPIIRIFMIISEKNDYHSNGRYSYRLKLLHMINPDYFWLVGCLGFNGPLRQYFSLYRAVSQREGERGEKG